MTNIRYAPVNPARRPPAMSQPPGVSSEPRVSPVMTRASTAPKPSPANAAQTSATHGRGAGPGRPRATPGGPSPETITPSAVFICVTGVMHPASQATLRGVCTQPVRLLRGRDVHPAAPDTATPRGSAETSPAGAIRVRLQSSERRPKPRARNRRSRDRCRPFGTGDLVRQFRSHGVDCEDPTDQRGNQSRRDELGSEARCFDGTGHLR